MANYAEREGERENSTDRQRCNRLQISPSHDGHNETNSINRTTGNKLATRKVNTEQDKLMNELVDECGGEKMSQPCASVGFLKKTSSFFLALIASHAAHAVTV